MMKTQLLISACLLASATCFARLGESEQQCEERYSELQTNGVPQACYGSNSRAYTKNNISTTCTFYNANETPKTASTASSGTSLAKKDLANLDLKVSKGSLRTAADKSRDDRSSDSPSLVCYKLNFKEKGSGDNESIKESIPSLLKANAGILTWKETEPGARWECINKKYIATFSPKKGLTIIDTSCPLYKKEQDKKQQQFSDGQPDGKTKILKGF